MRYICKTCSWIAFKNAITFCLIITGLSLTLSSCDAPSRYEVKKDFLMVNSTATIYDVYPGEGDDSGVEYHIVYRLPHDTKMHEDVWLYQDMGGEKWTIIFKSTDGKEVYRDFKHSGI